MNRFLMVDIGAGTMDILFFDMASGLHYKAVVKSPVLTIAEKADDLPGHLLITGVEMGGGRLSELLKRRTQDAEVVMSASAAATIHHNPERVRSLGIHVVEDAEAEFLKAKKKYNHLHLADLDITHLERIVRGFGVPFSFESIGICAQDHGVPPEGVSHLDYRHRLFKTRLDESPFPHVLLYGKEDIPHTFNRLTSIAKCAEGIPCEEIYVMDSSMAAILGASLDSQSAGNRKMLVMDIATSHTVGAALKDGEIAGFFEYHTRDITLPRLENLLKDLADGEIQHEKILEEGGHGAYFRKAIGFQKTDTIIATGPKRSMLKNSKLPIRLGAPLGDNMMTGTVGVFEAIRRVKGLGPPVDL